MILASVVFPEPGGPQKMHDPISPRRISSPRGFPGPSRCSWPRNSSRVPGRMRAARGSAERANRVGSDTGDGRRDTRNGKREAGNGKRSARKNCHVRRHDTHVCSHILYVHPMRHLQSLDVWRAAHDLTEVAYRLTTEPALSRHFALIDQIRRAALSIPANIAEGYALGTTTQFVRYLRISLGSAAELGSHLEMLRRLKLADATQVSEAATLCTRVISMLVGLLRKLGHQSRSRFPFPVSRVPCPGYEDARSRIIFVKKNTAAP